MSQTVANLQRALWHQPMIGGWISTPETLSDEQIASLKETWNKPSYFSEWREPYREPPPLPWWVTADPLIKLLIIALPVAALVWLLIG